MKRIIYHSRYKGIFSASFVFRDIFSSLLTITILPWCNRMFSNIYGERRHVEQPCRPSESWRAHAWKLSQEILNNKHMFVARWMSAYCNLCSAYLHEICWKFSCTCLSMILYKQFMHAWHTNNSNLWIIEAVTATKRTRHHSSSFHSPFAS